MERTVLRNIPGDEYNAPQRWWRRRLGRTQLMCPKCFSWFTLGKDFKIDREGNVNSVVYHVCEDDKNGWVVLPQLEGYNRR